MIPTSLEETFITSANSLGATVIKAEPAHVVKSLQESVGLNLEETIEVSSDVLKHFPALRDFGRAAGERNRRTALSRGLLGVGPTGTVAVADLEYQDRLLWLSAFRHIVLLPTASLVGTLADAAPFIRDWIKDGRCYATFISGPSRTSDIERVLTVGVHGPSEVVICLVEGWQPERA